MDNTQRMKISELTLAFAEGRADKEDVLELEQILDGNQEAIEYYVETLMDLDYFHCLTGKPLTVPTEHPSIGQLTAAMDNREAQMSLLLSLAEEEMNSPAIQLSTEDSSQELIQKVVYPPREKRKISKFTIFTLIASAAAGLLLVALYFSEPKSRPVASVTGNYYAVWENSSNVAGTRLWTDGSVYHLQHGVAEVTFDSGAVVLVESPADIEVMDDNEMFLRGRMTAVVPASAYGFTVHTVNSKVVDLGTQFGLTSSDQSGTEVHVRKGKVEHLVLNSNAKESLRNLVKAGQASRADNNGGFSRVCFENDQFRWDRPASYEAAVLETKPSAYYRFGQDVTAVSFDEISRTVVRNVFTGSVGFVRGPGIDPELENQALHFGGDPALDDEVGRRAFIADKVIEFTEGRSFSISLWVCPDQVKADSQNIIAYTDNSRNVRARFTNQLYLTDDNRFGFYLFDVSKDLPICVETHTPVLLHQWRHITASFANGQMRLYIDGKLQVSQSVNHDFIPQYFEEGGYWAIGVETGGVVEHRISRAAFKGAVDEISFYDRRLSDQEVWMLYEAAKEQNDKGE